MKMFEERKTNEDFEDDRDTPLILQIFHELGIEFSDKFCQVKSEKVPKKYKGFYKISEYDCKEEVYIDYYTYTLSAREIGNLADINVLNKIFPNCRRKNFGIRTLAELKLFFDDININNELVSPTTTKTSWFKLSLNHRNEIRKRYDDMLISHPDLIQSIDILGISFMI